MKALEKKTYIIASATLIAGLLAGWLIFGGPKSDDQPGDPGEKTEITGETIWTCSMHPQIRQSEPGDCPICGMDLIPLDDGESEGTDPNAIRMSPTAMQLASISTATVGKISPTKHVRLNGKVQTDERLVSSQTSHIPGRIEKLMVSFTGEFVNRGQTIAYVYSPELVTAQEELFEAQKMAETQPQLFSAAKEKLKNWKLTEDQIEDILNAGKAQEEFPVQADVSGYVTAKLVNTGDYIQKGETLFEIANLSRVWVLFDVYESDMSWIKKGDQVEFTIASLPGESFTGKISYLDPVIDPRTRVAKARVEYNNEDGKLKPEMFASGLVEARLAGPSRTLVVPKTAVMWTGRRSVVYVKTDSDQGVNFIMREVILGPDLGDSYLVSEGLREGEEIAVNGTFSIDAAAQLAGKPSMINPEGGVLTSLHDHGSGTTAEVSEERHSRETTQDVSLTRQAKEALQPLYIAYLGWKDALVNDQFGEAQQKATQMKASLNNISMSVFKGQSHEVWMDYHEKLENGLEHVHHFSEIGPLRKAFQTVSAIMIEMTNHFDPLEETIYVQHCPMADDNRGADWLSKEKEILNPYFGSSMLRCGEVTKEIK